MVQLLHAPHAAYIGCAPLRRLPNRSGKPKGLPNAGSPFSLSPNYLLASAKSALIPS